MTLPPPRPGDPYVLKSSRHRGMHWHGYSRHGMMECRQSLKEATQWVLDGGPDESW